MSRGNYSGGSTIIGRGGWSTYDPAESDSSHGRILKSKKSNKRKPQQKRKKAKLKKNMSALSLMHFILDRHLQGIEKFKWPRTVASELIDEIAKFKSPLSWVENQENPSDVISKKLKKLSNIQKGNSKRLTSVSYRDKFKHAINFEDALVKKSGKIKKK